MYASIRDPARPTPAGAYIGTLVSEGLMTPARAQVGVCMRVVYWLDFSAYARACVCGNAPV